MHTFEGGNTMSRGPELGIHKCLCRGVNTEEVVDQNPRFTFRELGRGGQGLLSLCPP